MNFNIGTVIKLLRKHKKMTQSTLAKNICSIKQLSRIESNLSIPTALLLKEFSYKLGEDISEYFLYLDQDNPISAKIRISELEILSISSDHFTCYKYACEYIADNVNNESYYLKRLYWYKYTSALHLANVASPTREDFIGLLKTNSKVASLDNIFDHFIKPFEYQILSSIMLLYLKNEDYNTAEFYLKKIVDSFEKNYINTQDNSYLKALYNLARIYYVIDKNYDSALYYSNKGLDTCVKNSSFSFLDDFCLLKGKALYHMGKIEEGKLFIKTFIYLSKLVDNHENLEKIILELQDYYDLKC